MRRLQRRSLPWLSVALVAVCGLHVAHARNLVAVPNPHALMDGLGQTGREIVTWLDHSFEPDTGPTGPAAADGRDPLQLSKLDVQAAPERPTDAPSAAVPVSLRPMARPDTVLQKTRQAPVPRISQYRPRVLRGGGAWEGAKEGPPGTVTTGVGRTVSGPVTHVRDGDTIEVAGTAVRFDTLDCAEWNTPQGQKATARMKRLVRGAGTVTCRLTGQVSYDRLIGSCTMADGRDVANVMVAEGLCQPWS